MGQQAKSLPNSELLCSSVSTFGFKELKTVNNKTVSREIEAFIS